MNVRPRGTGNRNAHLLWIAILVVAVITFLVDAAGWFPDGWLVP